MGGSLPDADRFVGMQHMERFGIRLRVDGHRLEAEVVAGPDDPDGNFAPIGNKYFLHNVDHLCIFHHREHREQATI